MWRSTFFRFLYARQQQWWEIVIRNILNRYRLLIVINVVACDKQWKRNACKLSKWQQLSTVLIKINIIVFFILYECCWWYMWEIYGKINTENMSHIVTYMEDIMIFISLFTPFHFHQHNESVLHYYHLPHAPHPIFNSRVDKKTTCNQTEKDFAWK